MPLHGALQRKVAFPFVTLIMTLLAVPFAVTTGRRGALYGVGVGIVLAIVYWMTLSVFGAIGAGGLISPMLAAWAPNILFAAAAAVSDPDGPNARSRSRRSKSERSRLVETSDFELQTLPTSAAPRCLSQKRPDVPGFVFVVSTTNRMRAHGFERRLRRPGRADRRDVVEADRALLGRLVEIDGSLPALAAPPRSRLGEAAPRCASAARRAA